MRKQILILTALIVLGLWFAAYASQSQETMKNVKALETAPISETCPSPKVVVNERCVSPVACPEGTTLIDYKDEARQEPICKNNPTGCPYGDSIPVDSPKCVSPEVENTTSTSVNTEEIEVFYGK